MGRGGGTEVEGQVSLGRRYEENAGEFAPRTHLDLVRTQGALAALLLEPLLDALQDLSHEVAVVDAEEVRELRRAPAALLERRLVRRWRARESADLGRERGDGDARRQRTAPFRPGGAHRRRRYRRGGRECDGGVVGEHGGARRRHAVAIRGAVELVVVLVAGGVELPVPCQIVVQFRKGFPVVLRITEGAR